MNQLIKGIFIGIFCATLVQLPVWLAGQTNQDVRSGRIWQAMSGASAGSIVLRLDSCPSSYTEVSQLEGKTVIGTLSANGDVGQTGGSDNITQVLNHTHAVNITDPGHTHLTQRYPTATGTSSGFTIDTSMSGTLADNTLPTKTATTGITATTSNPAGGVASIDNRSAFVKVIFCSKN